MKYAVCLLACTGLVLGTETAAADEDAWGYDSRDYITPSIIFTRAVNDDIVNDGVGFHLGITRPLSDRYHIEGSWFRYSQDLTGFSENQRRTGFGVTGLRMFDTDSALQPYLSFGAGMMETRMPGGEHSGMFSSLGLGMTYRTSENMALRLDARYMYDLSRAIQPDWNLMLGASLRFGERPRTYTPAPEPAPEPAPPPAREPAPQPDPTPPPPEPEADVVIQFDPVLFEFDSSALTATARERLDHAAATLDEHGNIRVEVIGYTCDIGTSEYNDRLAERRARAVADYLESKGVDRGRMRVRGFGEAVPPADDEQGRTRNRRVDIKPRD